MTDPKIETVQAIYAAFGRGDVPFILDQLTDDVDWAAEADSKEAPWWGIHKSKTAVPSFFQGLADSIDVTEFTPLSFAANDSDVMAIIRFGVKVKANGRTSAMNLHHWWKFRDGKVCQYRGSEDTALTAALLS